MEQAVCRQYIVYCNFIFFYLLNCQIAAITMFNDSKPYVRIVNPAHLFCVTVLDGRNGLTQLCLKWNIDRLLMWWRRAVTTCIIDAKINCYLKKTWKCQKCVHSSKHTNIEPIINCEVAVCSWFWFKQSLHASLRVTDQCLCNEKSIQTETHIYWHYDHKQ